MSGIDRIILIQPPFVQLNSPYPAPYYLKSFLETRPETRGLNVTVLDHSIGLFERIFSRSGLERIFDDASRRPGTNGETIGGARAAHIHIIERFLSERDMWIASIDRLAAFLRGKDPEWGHFLALANGCVPGGPRTDAYLAERDGDISPDEAKVFATALLSDVADFITCTLDSGFGLIRYTPVMTASLNSGRRDFAAVQKSLDGYVMNSFYRPMLNEEWNKLEGGVPAAGIDSGGTRGMFLLGLTIPFPGCLAPALVCAESAKKRFGSGARIAAGGGYVNTELRFLDTPEFFDYFDYVSFDRGYGSLLSILEHIASGEKNGGESLYKTMYRFKGSVVAPPALNGKTAAAQAAVNGAARDDKFAAPEDEAARTVFPDYSTADFNRYLYPVDDANPMHRLWSDGHWLKAYLAHGCYWHSCAFCDTGLDYIRNFIPADPAALFAHLKKQAEKTGVRGIHLCDEAAPVSSLLEFALRNRDAGLPLSFWGNIRFEKDFTPDAAAILAAGGLVGVSAGLEVATERGFKRLGKGIDLESAVRASAAFKEAGILTHAYLIYGYWDEDEQEIVDSAEILRQLFSHGLLDSAFWHKFILTRHSRVYAEKQRGLHPRLKVTGEGGGRGTFACNDLGFEGEEKYDKYTDGLDRLLRLWMAGETEIPVQEAFPFRVKAPSVPPDLVAVLLNRYALERERVRAALPGVAESVSAAIDTEDTTLSVARGNVLFLGSIPGPRQEGENIFLIWRWRLARREIKARGKAEAEKLAALLQAASQGRGIDAAEFYFVLEEISGSFRAKKIWSELRENGLMLEPFSKPAP